MKKVLFLAALLLVCFSGVTNAQTRKQREDAKREAWKKERQEKKALEAQQDSVSYVQAINALKNGSFVLEADNVVFRYNPQIEMFARFKTKSSFHKTKRII